MKKHLLFTLLLIAGTFSGLLAQSADNWSLSGGAVTWTQETTTVNSGTYSLRAFWTSQANQYLNADTVAVTEGATMNVSINVFDNDIAGRARLCVIFNTGNSSDNYYGGYSKDTTVWQTIDYSGPVPVGATEAMLQIRFYDVSSNWDGDAVVYVDDVSLDVGAGNLVANPGFENWTIPAFHNIVEAYTISETEVDVVYDGSITAVDPTDYLLNGTADVTFTTATIDGTDDRIVHLSGASAAIANDLKIDTIHDANTKLSLYAGILPVAYTNTTNPGGTMSRDTVATFAGIVSASDNFNGIWIADAEGAYNGVLVYSTSFVKEVAVGDSILISGKLTYYNNLTELVDPRLITTYSIGNTPWGPSVITAADIEENIPADTDPGEMWEGQLVTILNAKITKDKDAAHYFYSANVAEGTDTFRIGDNVDYQLRNITLSVNSLYNITGVVDYEDGAYRINPRSMADIDAIVPSMVKAYAVSNTAIDVVFDKELTAADPIDFLLNGTADVTFTTATVDALDKMIVHLSGASVPLADDLQIDTLHMGDNKVYLYAGILPIAYLNEVNPTGTMSNDTMATFHGIVSAHDGYNNVWISESANALDGTLIYDFDFDNLVALGDEITVAGVRVVYYNLTEIKNPVLVEIVSQNNAVYGPTTVTGATIEETIAADTDPAEQWEGQLVKIVNAEVTIDLNTTDYYYTASDDNGSTSFRIGDNVDYQLKNITLAVGESYTITGVVDYMKGAYRINPRGMSDILSANATLTDVKVNGTSIPDFSASVTDYVVELDPGTTTVPTVVPTTGNAGATPVVTDATDLTGDEAARTTTIVVTAEDGVTQLTYSIVFVVRAPATDATLSELRVDNLLITGFAPGTLDYTYILPANATVIPTVTATPTDANATKQIIDATDLTGDANARTTKVEVTAEDGTTTLTYNVLFELESSATESIAFENIMVYPTLVVKDLVVTNAQVIDYVQVLSLTGSVAKTVDAEGKDELEIDCTELKSGIYILKAVSGEKVSTYRFVKQ